ncbi:MAG: peptidoglycan DD-metalloendopeptidase family protein [Bacteroidota bacterium]|nr:peptidoglycan DD-metalloendopeptidase family protein [Bacteroidota bacterium]MDX5430972.1 peptidoglycan DD-metalloendopeptidase family protein [Bacteroidota bacterium]MDX5469723.1 peptidoglycan DD-metalloendopeptidase family protein [Bacteroidota bacterium]
MKQLKLVSFLLILLGSSLLPVYAQQESDDEYNDDEVELNDSMVIDSADFEDIQLDNFLEDFLHDIGYYFDTTNVPAMDSYTGWDMKKIHPYEQKLDSITDSTMLVLVEGEDCFFHPPTVGAITSGFGIRRWGRRYKFHYGTDLKLTTGDPVYSIFDGVVRIAQYSKSYGYVVVVRHYNGLETIYAHFSKLLVVPGMSIRAGEPIGLGGSTGRSTGPHLHFEVRYKGVAFNAEKIIDFSTNTLKSDTIYIDKSLFDHIKEVKKINAAKYHKVRSGETLGHIARRYGTSVKAIQRLNGMKTTRIRAGQTIRVR